MMNYYKKLFKNYKTPKFTGDYWQNKSILHDFAVEWQFWASNENLYMSEMAFWCETFTKLGKRYGLLKEFKINGIC